MIIIREILDKDIKQLAKIYEYFALNTTYTYYSQRVSPQYMKALLSGEGHFCLVAEDGRKIVGYAHISPCNSIKRYRCEIAIYLHPDYIGKGVGTKLALEAENCARRRGYRKMQAAACSENYRSQKLFDSLNYNRTELKTAAAEKFGRILDTQFFEKDI